MTKPASEDSPKDSFSGWWRCMIILLILGLLVHQNVTHRNPHWKHINLERKCQRDAQRIRTLERWMWQHQADDAAFKPQQPSQ